MRSRRPRSSARGKEKGRAPHPFLMRLLHAPIGAPPPFFLREEFLATLFGLAFLGVGKTRVRSRIARTDMRMSQRDIFQGTSGHFQRTGYGATTTHRYAKLSGAAHARRVADAAIARPQRFDPARAVRFAGIVPLLHREALPPAAHMPRRRPGGVRSQALVPQGGEEAQDAAAGMEPARAPQVAVAPPAAKPAPPRPLRRGSDPPSRSCVAPARRRCTVRAFWVMSAPNCAGRVLHGARRSFFFPGQLRCLAP